jgi:hypothetical protein
MLSTVNYTSKKWVLTCMPTLPLHRVPCFFDGRESESVMRKFALRDRWTNKEDESTITSQSMSAKVENKEVADT